MRFEQLELQLAAFRGELQVVSVVGRESLSALYRFDVRAAVTDADDRFAQRVVDTPASLFMRLEHATRPVHGIVTACEALSRSASGATTFVLQIEPRLARLERRKTSRIFQDATAQEIVGQVLDLSRVRHRWRIHRKLPTRTYCAQYDETDYSFVSRLCASEGIFFCFDHSPDAAAVGEEVLVLSDSVDAYEPLDGRPDLRFRQATSADSGLTVDEDNVFRFAVRHAMRAQRVLLRSFDLEKPPIPQRDAASTDGATAMDELDSMRSFVDSGRTIYEHHQAREQALLNPIPAKLALEAETADAVVAEGETSCRRLVPGRRFRLVDHVLAEVDGEYAVVACSHEAFAPQAARPDQPLYTNRFTAVPASVPFRPQRPPRVVRQTLETATVVGPIGQEIHTDELGRIKVQFHWDLHGRLTDRSSCWLRVAQPWAGPGYGAQFLPRVGTEVLIGYIDGDADRPVVMGCLHNGLNGTPFPFPKDSERSGFKTWTTPDGKGGHELSFDDRAGAEVISMRSAGTMDLAATQDMAVRAEGNLRVVSGGSRADEVLLHASTSVGGTEIREVGGARHSKVGEGDSLDVGGNQEVTIHGAEVRRIEGVALHIFDKSRATVIGSYSGGEFHEQVGVSGEYRVTSVKEMSLESKTRVQLVCGKSTITLLPDSILIDSPVIQLQAKERIALVQGDPPAATVVLEGSASIAGGTVIAKGGGKGGGQLLLDAEAHLDGSLVKLNCGASGGGGASVRRSLEGKNRVKFTVRPDGLDEGVTSVTLVIATPSGEVVEKECAVGGSVELEGKDGEVFTVVETRVGGKSVPVRRIGEAPETQ